MPILPLARRSLLAAALAALLTSPAAGAHAWPATSIRCIVPFAPGGTTDFMARAVGEKLGAALGRTIVIDNKPGQGGSAGAAELARAAPDGQTIGGGTIGSHAIDVTLYGKLPYDPVTVFEPITVYATQSNVLLRPTVSAATVADCIALLKAHPTRYSFGSTGAGLSQHISGEQFKTLAGVKMERIPYRSSGQMLPGLLGATLPVAASSAALAAVIKADVPRLDKIAKDSGATAN